MQQGSHTAPLRIPHRPATASSKISWLLKTSRSLSDHPQASNPELVAQRMQAQSGARMSARRFARFESGRIRFSTAEAIAYESALGLPLGHLLDPMMHIARVLGSGSPVRASTSTRSMFEFAYGVADNVEFSTLDWVDHSVGGIRGNHDLNPGSRIGELTANALLNRYSRSFEAEERLLTEAVIGFDQLVFRQLKDRITQDPLHTFNLLECLGRMASPGSATMLGELASEVLNDVTAQTLLEAWRRRSRRGIPPVVANRISPTLLDASEEILLNTSASFTAREEALALVSTTHRSWLHKRMRSYAQDQAEEIRELGLMIDETTRRELIDSIVRRTVDEIRKHTGVATGAPVGLQWMIRDAIFSPERVGRLGNAVVLAAVPFADELSIAAAAQVSDYLVPHPGIARALVRLVTKLQTPGGDEVLSRVRLPGRLDEGVLLSLAWCAGAGHANWEQPLLSLASRDVTETTARVIVLSATRRGYKSVLRQLQSSNQAVARGAAILALSNLESPRATPNSEQTSPSSVQLQTQQDRCVTCQEGTTR